MLNSVECVSFPNKDGSESVILHIVLLTGKLVLHTPKPKAKDAPEAQTA